MNAPKPHRCATVTLSITTALLASCTALTQDEHEARSVVMNFVEAANARDFGRVESLLLPDFTRHSQATPDVQVRSRSDMLDFLKANAKAFGRERVELTQTLVEGKLGAFRGTYTGTQTGQMGPFAATGRTAKVDISGTFRVEGNRIAELWILWDNLALLGQLGHGPAAAPQAKSDDERNKALARAWFDEVINRRDLDAIKRCYADNYVHHGPGGMTIRGIPATRQFAGQILAASADRRATVLRQVAAGDFVVTHFRSRGRMTGPFLGRKPTGKVWVTEGICISRIANGKIAEDWEIVSHSGL